MECVNHSGVNAAAYCQNCGKALCQACMRKGTGGETFCEPCFAAWSAAANAQGPYVPPADGPSPGLATVLGAIPGVGAMYNGQFLKGLVHVAIFAVLVSAAQVFDVFGWFIAAWIFYQMFDAYHTAKARRDGDPLPDPLGLNELSYWFVASIRAQRGPTPPHQEPGAPGASAGGNQGAGQASHQGAPFQAPYQSPYQAPYQTTYPGAAYQSPYPPYPPPPPPSGAAGPGFPPIPPIPPIPPVHPAYCHRREPVGAIILIALGILFLLGQFEWFSWHVFHYFWPLLLIGLGVWMIVNRVQETRGVPPTYSQMGPHNDPSNESEDHPQGGNK
jgi:TM2 domain-containing membrane protein YozV